VGAIVSPAGVVFAVVWTAPPVANVGNNPVAAADTQPARMLPAPDVQPASLPAPDFNVYANTLSGVVPARCATFRLAFTSPTATRTLST
jgi:hypothetical protein